MFTSFMELLPKHDLRQPLHRGVDYVIVLWGHFEGTEPFRLLCWLLLDVSSVCTGLGRRMVTSAIPGLCLWITLPTSPFDVEMVESPLYSSNVAIPTKASVGLTFNSVCPTRPLQTPGRQGLQGLVLTDGEWFRIDLRRTATKRSDSSAAGSVYDADPTPTTQNPPLPSETPAPEP